MATRSHGTMQATATATGSREKGTTSRPPAARNKRPLRKVPKSSRNSDEAWLGASVLMVGTVLVVQLLGFRFSAARETSRSRLPG